MIPEYYNNEDEIRSEFHKEFISLWRGWLGRDEFYKLDEVTEIEWSRFNHLLKLLHCQYEMYVVNWDSREAKLVDNIDNLLPTYEEAMNRGSANFSQFIIPELNAVLTEECDYTFIFWHINNGSREKLEPWIRTAKLFNFRD
ncbi:MULTISPECIES: hypothetical protein [Vibrio]|uniref:hypothetical protein n=1 Tax=Vibrio TaxID=662 RepID=UPI0001B94C4F|nr:MULTISPECIES: hypothetical protein [Vibrio]EEX30845.1 hypothetical protein VIC_003787 [Vibrio coralliilyticus ATCC BAA-450]MCM5511647.1 hypothetical protein [Vibrio sp. SCSIO 43169]MDE3896044.1 hypothetical protein [Vibrio sp. CC007]